MQSVKSDFRKAMLSDEPALRENWRLSFGDTDDYLDFFFSRRFDPDNTLVAAIDGRAVSQLFLLPVSLRTQANVLSAVYLFAAATHPQFRAQGIMSSLVCEAKALCRSRGIDAIALLPGTSDLYRYYAKLGFETSFFRRRFRATREVLAQIAIPYVQAHDALPVLHQILSGRDGLYWDAHALEYALSEQQSFRGPCAASTHAVVCMDDAAAVCLCAPEHFGECASLLLAHSDLHCFDLTIPSDIPYGTIEDGGMLCTLSNQTIQLRDAFLSFAME